MVVKRVLAATVLLLTLTAGAFAQSSTGGVTLQGGSAGETMINDVMQGFLAPIEADIVRAIGYAKGLMWVLLTLDLIFLGFNVALGRGANLETIVLRVLAMGIIVFVVENFALATAWPGPSGSFHLPSSSAPEANAASGSVPSGTVSVNGDSWAQSPREPTGNETTAFADHPGLAGRFLNMLVGMSAGSSGLNANLLINPGSILVFAQDALVAPVMAEVSKVKGRTFGQFALDAINPLKGIVGTPERNAPSALGLKIEAFIYQLCVLAIYVVLTVNLCLAVLEFYIILLFAMILVPFVSFEPLRFIGAHAFSAVIGQAVRTAIVVTVITLGVSVMWHLAQQLFGSELIVHANGTVTVNPNAGTMVQLSSLLVLLAGSALLLYLALHAPNLAMSLLMGTSALSAPHMMQNAYAGARLASLPLAALSGTTRFAAGAWHALRGGGDGRPSQPAASEPPAPPSPPPAPAGMEFAPPSIDSSAALTTAAALGVHRRGDYITLPPGARASLYLPNERSQVLYTGALPWEKRAKGGAP